MNKDLLQKARKVLWAAFLVSLPVTNFPYFPTAMGGSRVSVRPLLIYPLFFDFADLTHFVEEKITKSLAAISGVFIISSVLFVNPRFQRSGNRVE